MAEVGVMASFEFPREKEPLGRPLPRTRDRLCPVIIIRILSPVDKPFDPAPERTKWRWLT